MKPQVNNGLVTSMLSKHVRDLHPDVQSGIKLMQTGLMQAEGVAKMATKPGALTKLAQLAKL